MDFERVLHKASVVCLNAGWRTEDHFVDATEIVRTRGSQDKRTGRECAGLTRVIRDSRRRWSII